MKTIYDAFIVYVERFEVTHRLCTSIVYLALAVSNYNACALSIMLLFFLVVFEKKRGISTRNFLQKRSVIIFIFGQERDGLNIRDPIMRHAWSVSPIRDTLPWLTPDNYFPVRFPKKPIGRDYRMAGRFLLFILYIDPITIVRWAWSACHDDRSGKSTFWTGLQLFHLLRLVSVTKTGIDKMKGSHTIA